jgi:glycosidase
VIYFVLPDRFANGDPANDTGGIAGDRLTHGFDPADKGFYHGGDLKGLIEKLDYIQGLGASAIWVGPIFKNKPVQGGKGQESAGYHGYWITDFLHVDPHFGTDADFAALVGAAHARGMKVYMDIIVNHTADVIQYREASNTAAPYRSRADYPFSRRGGVAGAPINAGFAGDDDARAANWAHMTDPAFAYTPYVPAGEEKAKNPAWLNNPIWYHNRGDTDWKGESAQYGDFVGLDDLVTENPRVVKGFIEIYGSWIDRFGIDGYRIDTAKHVNPQFWRAFVPAMQARARLRGIPISTSLVRWRPAIMIRRCWPDGCIARGCRRCWTLRSCARPPMRPAARPARRNWPAWWMMMRSMDQRGRCACPPSLAIMTMAALP